MSELLVATHDPKYWHKEVSMQKRNVRHRGIIYRHKEDKMLWKWKEHLVRAHDLEEAVPLFLEQARGRVGSLRVRDWKAYGNALLVIEGYRGKLYQSAANRTLWKWKGITFTAKDYRTAIAYLMENVKG